MTIRFTCLLLLGVLTVDAQVIPHPEAHAHNDYEHEHPLRDALKYGFTTIEADVYEQNNKLIVSHNQPAPDAPTLDQLYLQPLDSMLAAQNGNIYPGYDDGKCFLMIDFKTAARPTYEALLSTLEKYPHILQSLQQHGQLQLFVSGNRPVSQIIEASAPLVALDGRPDDLGKGISSDRMPVVSEAFAKVCQWRGSGEPSREDAESIARLAQAVHKENKKLRLWAAPDTPEAWTWLLAAGVDIINTDKLQALDAFLRARR